MGAHSSDDEGWEALPSARATAETYANEVQRQRRAAARDHRMQHAHLLGQLAHANGAPPPSAPPEDTACAHAPGWGGSSFHDGSFYSDAGGGGGGGAYAAGSWPQQHPHGGFAGGGGAPPSRSQVDVLLLDPPTWLPDSFASHCGSCHLPFKPVLRLRHHCRLCGKVFCHACCGKRLLLPPRYNLREPQRACEMCSSLLQPLQPYLTGTLSRCVQPPVHDALDAVSLRSWLNFPVSGSLEDDAYKATNILRTFMAASRLEPERQLPASVLRGARGLALMSVLRVGAGWSATVGTGLVVSRQLDGSWSPPCAAACYGVGWGAQIGGELADVVLVLRTDEALQAFCSSAHLAVSGSAAASLGPVGRRAQAGLQVGAAGGGAAVGYSCSRGAFVGVAVEGSVFVVRDAANLAFYGYQATARQLLVEGIVPQPPAASLLYEALHNLTLRYECRDAAVHLPAPVASDAVRHSQQQQQLLPAAAAAASRGEAEGRAGRAAWGEGEGHAPQGIRAKAAAALRGAASAGAAALAGARGARGGAGSDGAGLITGSVDAPDASYSRFAAPPPAAAPAARPAAGSFGEEFRLPSAPRHVYETEERWEEEGSEGEYEPQLTWD